MVRKVVLRDSSSQGWLVFEQPEDVMIARAVEEVRDLLETVQQRVDNEGLFAAGFLTYEAAPAFDDALATRPPGALPVACFGLFQAPQEFVELPADPQSAALTLEWAPTTSRRSYMDGIAAIKRQIELGNCYQVNFTMRQEAQIDADPWDLFWNIAIDAPYAAYLDCGDHTIVSASPELFFSLAGTELTCRPMKGTAARAMTSSVDRAVASELQSSAKNRAENVMITDMIRNDMGRVADAGSVQLESLYDVEKYPTVWQMTSTVTATTSASLPEILAALFPCASVTGAPKASSMSIIAELEDTPREIYTGAIGYLAPSRQAQFSVAIRTVRTDNSSRVATYGTGGGIVWDSDPEDEYQECQAKSQILTSTAGGRNFELLETILWDRADGYFLLEEHLDRLHDSADYFDFQFDRARTAQALNDEVQNFVGDKCRVRLLLSRAGSVSIESVALPGDISTAPHRVRLAPDPININNPFLYHKTTNRVVYEQALEAAEDCDDVLLWNADGFITETSIANVILEIDGALFTPPVSCGLLGGVYRSYLLREGNIRERQIHIDELGETRELILINSVRGRYPATFCTPTVTNRSSDGTGA
jgi:para-aminobenzoate synthetase/4-amino-4-deoxychorismate lyase